MLLTKDEGKYVSTKDERKYAADDGKGEVCINDRGKSAVKKCIIINIKELNMSNSF